MKLVIYNAQNKVINTIENIVNPIVNGKDVNWETGAMTGINLPFLLVEDDVQIGETVDDVIVQEHLKQAKDAKDKELNLACQQSILSGFTHVIGGITYWFSYDYEAQGNFRDGRDILKDGILPEVPWTVRVGGKDGEYDRIQVNMEIMNELTLAIMNHKMGNIGEYRDVLMPRVKMATTIQEVEAVTWDE
jgi:hypothetical protein